MEVGHMIALLRESKNISQKRLARDMKVSPGAVGMWETNTRLPKLETFVELADYFSVSADLLLFYDRTIPLEDRISDLENLPKVDPTPKEPTKDQKADLMRETFLKLNEGNQYILMGKAMELLKEESKLSPTVHINTEKRA